jgi:nickel-dependent lactate racemase
MKTVSVPWGMWYGDKKFDMTFPDAWDVTVPEMKGGPDIGDEGIRRAFAEPIGAPPLREVAQGRRDAAILIDDLTRPTPSYRVLPYILEELAEAGLGDDDVRIICAIAAHRSMTRQDFVKKIGLDLVDRLQVINHNAYDNLEFYGNSPQGIPIWVNREFARSDLKIAAGMITPRGPIFGGGSKLLLPGACGRQTIYANHEYCPQEVFRQHLDEVAEMVGLEYIVNPLLNGDLGIMAMVTGDPEEAYWHGVEIGKDLYRTEIPEDMDVVICSSWPKDSEGTQSAMAMVPLRGKPQDKLFRENASVVVATASPEGLGFHSVMGPGTLYRLRHIRPQRRDDRPPTQQFVFSPNMNKYDVRSLYGDEAIFCKTWDQLMERLTEIHGPSPRACVFPCGAIQYGGGLD